MNYIESNISMNKPNKDILIYNGKISIGFEDHRFEALGKFIFKWLPNQCVYYTISFAKNIDYDIKMNFSSELIVFIDNKIICKISHYSVKSYGNNNKIKINGFLYDKFILGNKENLNDYIRFSIPNLKEFYGERIEIKNENSKIYYSGRIMLDAGEYVITIDKRLDFSKSFELLINEGGFIILYAGEIKKKAEIKISYDEYLNISNLFTHFISFLNGRRTSMFFATGYNENKLEWTDYTNKLVDIQKNVSSWTGRLPIKGYNDLFKNFDKYWQNENDKNFLISAIHWYVEANGDSGFIHGSLVMAQMALELIYNWLIVEKLGIVQGRDSKNMDTANKIRILLSQYKIDMKIPSVMEELLAYAKSNNIADGPEAIIQMRNSIVHSEEKKRIKLFSIDNMIVIHALELCIFYIEIMLLHILEYKGAYMNRCTNKSEKM